MKEEERKTAQLASPQVDCFFLFFYACKLQRNNADAAYSGGGCAVRPMVIMDGLKGSVIVEVGMRRLRVLPTTRCHVIIIIVVVGISIVRFSLELICVGCMGCAPKNSAEFLFGV